MASEVSETTSKWRRRTRRALTVPLRPSSRSDACTSVRPACSAGASPNRTPAISVTTSVNDSTTGSTPISSAARQVRGRDRGERAQPPPHAIASPAMPPAAAVTTLSVRSCDTMRHRPAPIAVRTEISRTRPSPRTSSRLATFAHAIRSTTTTRAEHDPERALHVADHLVAQRTDDGGVVFRVPSMPQ
jgi:hypothetical protein